MLLKISTAIRGFEYRPDRGRFRGWLYQITHNEIIRHGERQIRQAGGARAGSDIDAAESVQARNEDSEWIEEFTAHLFQVALDRVRPQFEAQTWTAFEMVCLKNDSADDAARALSMPVAQVYQAKSRIQKRLREEVLVLAEDTGVFSS